MACKSSVGNCSIGDRLWQNHLDDDQRNLHEWTYCFILRLFTNDDSVMMGEIARFILVRDGSFCFGLLEPRTRIGVKSIYKFKLVSFNKTNTEYYKYDNVPQ